ncbi:MFS transporter [Kitasatospora sp. NPDC127035]|uniref:MFS transporter n=1 Tax=Kitasatospora sp. NPDC127035 TaxID=3347111 RepID=UPI003657BB23
MAPPAGGGGGRGGDPPPPRTGARIDWAGVGLLTGGVLALTLVGSWGGTAYGWTSPQVLGAAAVAVVALARFVRVERRAVEPLIPPALFRHRAVTEALVLGFLLGGLMLVLVGYLPQYLQFVQGASPTTGGLLLVPLMLGMIGAQLVTARLTARGGSGRHHPLLGSAVALAGTLLLLTLGTDTPQLLASALTVVAGAGIGLVMQSTLLATMAAVPPRDMGAAMGSVMLFRTIGGSLGMAALGAVYTARLSSSLSGGPGADAAGPTADGLTPAAVDHLPAQAAEAVRTAVTTGLHGTLLGAAAIAAAAVVVAALARRAAPAPAGDRAPEPAPADLG